jgi:REJ domain
MTVITNGPPIPGSFSVVPKEGQEMTTPFVFVASSWAATELPITYEFGFLSPGATYLVLVSVDAFNISTLTKSLE